MSFVLPIPVRIAWDPASKQGMQNISTIDSEQVTIIAEELYKEDEGLVYYLRVYVCLTKGALRFD